MLQNKILNLEAALTTCRGQCKSLMDQVEAEGRRVTVAEDQQHAFQHQAELLTERIRILNLQIEQVRRAGGGRGEAAHGAHTHTHLAG